MTYIYIYIYMSLGFKRLSKFHTNVSYCDDIIKKCCKDLLFSIPQYLERKKPEIRHGQLPVTFK